MTETTPTGTLTFSAIEPGSGLAAALAEDAGRRAGRDRPLRPARPRRRRLPHQPEVEPGRRDSPGEKKYVVCNADEGEPGTFKDRVILCRFRRPGVRGHDHRRLVPSGPGTASSTSASEYTYLRAAPGASAPPATREEPPGQEASPAAQGFDFDIDIHMGSGAYVCGEETALIESLGGPPRRAPQPPAVPHRHRLPRPAHDRQQRRDLRLGRLHPRPRAPTGSRATAPRSPPATSSSASPATASGPASTSSPWASRSRELLQRSGRRRGQGGAGGRGLRPVRARRPVRPHDRLTRTSPPAARSSSSARSATCSTWPRTSWSSSSTNRAASVRPAARACRSCWKASTCSSAASCSMDLSQGALLAGRDACSWPPSAAWASRPPTPSSRSWTLPGRDPRPDRWPAMAACGGQGIEDGQPLKERHMHEEILGGVDHLRAPKSQTLRTVEAIAAGQGDRQDRSSSPSTATRSPSRWARRSSRRPGAGHPHPHALLPRGPLPGRRVPDLRGRGRGAADACRRRAATRSPRRSTSRPTRPRSAAPGGTSSTCCWPTTTATATPAGATTTASCRRWPRNTAWISSASATWRSRATRSTPPATPWSAT